MAGELTAMLQAESNAEAPLERMNVLRKCLQQIWQKPAEEVACCCAQPPHAVVPSSGEEPLIRDATKAEQAEAAAAVEEESDAEEILMDQPGVDSPHWSYTTSEDENLTENDAEDTPVILKHAAAPANPEMVTVPQADGETPPWVPPPLQPALATEIDGETPVCIQPHLATPTFPETENETTPQASVWFRRILRRVARIERRR